MDQFGSMQQQEVKYLDARTRRVDQKPVRTLKACNNVFMPEAVILPMRYLCQTNDLFCSVINLNCSAENSVVALN